MKKRAYWIAAGLLPFILLAADILVGSSGISPSDVWKSLSGGEVPEQTRTVVIDIRLMKAVTALLAGISVSVSGLMMQTLFRNPLAGPYVLGISSGASLGAAVFVLGASSSPIIGESFIASIGLAGAAWAGAAGILAIIAIVSRKIKDIMIILILGMMIGSGIDAVVQILQFLSDEMSLKSYVIWTMGSLGNVTDLQLVFLGAATAAGIFLSAISVKPLNLLALGETYAVTMGLDIKKSRNTIFLATVLLSGTVTAFCGPLGFIGLAVPHLTRFIAKTADHRVLLPGTMICGASLMLLCDIISKTAAMPVNAITSLLGIPVIIWVVINPYGRKKGQYNA